jgi:acyl-CoA thioester hydrolase
MKDEVEYFKKVRLQEEITVTYALAGEAADRSRFLLQHDILKREGELSARITSGSGWLAFAERKLTAPPPSLLVVNLPEKTDDFVILRSSARGRSSVVFARQARRRVPMRFSSRREKWPKLLSRAPA